MKVTSKRVAVLAIVVITGVLLCARFVRSPRIDEFRRAAPAVLERSPPTAPQAPALIEADQRNSVLMAADASPVTQINLDSQASNGSASSPHGKAPRLSNASGDGARRIARMQRATSSSDAIKSRSSTTR